MPDQESMVSSRVPLSLRRVRYISARAAQMDSNEQKLDGVHMTFEVDGVGIEGK